MKKQIGMLVVVLLAAPLWAGVSGDYLEVRTADIFTGPCFANAEVNLTGKEAIMAWHVRQGEWQGTDLSGLSVVAVVRTAATLGDPFAEQQSAQAVLLLDARASAPQRDSLVSLARAMAPDLLEDIVRVESAPIQMQLGSHGSASLRAGELAKIETRGLHEGDHLCGNETVYYPPLAECQAVPAYTRIHEYRGEGLNTTWSSPSKRSAFVGTFSRSQ